MVPLYYRFAFFASPSRENACKIILDYKILRKFFTCFKKLIILILRFCYKKGELYK